MSQRLYDLICGLVANRKSFAPRLKTITRLIGADGALRPESRIAIARRSRGATGEAVFCLGPEGGQGHPSGTVSVVVASYGRQDILERTLDSFVEFNTYPIKEFVVIRHGEVAKDASLVQKYRSYHLQWKTAHTEIPNGCLSDVIHSEMKTTSGLVFYCTDDCEFTRSGFIEKLLWFLQHNHELAQVLLPERAQSDNYPVWEYLFYAEGIPYRLVRDDTNTDIIRSFYFEPGLKRLEAYSSLMSVGSSTRGRKGERFYAEAADARNAHWWPILTAVPVDDESKGYIRRVVP